MIITHCQCYFKNRPAFNNRLKPCIKYNISISHLKYLTEYFKKENLYIWHMKQ